METTLTSNKSLLAWLDEKVELTKPSKIVWIDGSKEQIDALKAEAVETGEMIKLNEELLPDCYLHRTAENDVARVEDRTLICSKKEEDAGPTNHWMEPSKAYKMLYDIAAGAYEGRTMYIIAYAQPATSRSYPGKKRYAEQSTFCPAAHCRRKQSSRK